MNNKWLIGIVFLLILVNTEIASGSLDDDYYVHDILDNTTNKWNSTNVKWNNTNDYFFRTNLNAYGIIWSNVTAKTMDLDDNWTIIFRIFYGSSTMVVNVGVGNNSLSGNLAWADKNDGYPFWMQIDSGGTLYLNDQANQDKRCTILKPTKNNFIDIMIQMDNHAYNISFRNTTGNLSTAVLDSTGWEKENTCNGTINVAFDPQGGLGMFLEYYTNDATNNNTIWDAWYRYEGLTAPATPGLQYHDEVGNFTTWWEANSSFYNSGFHFETDKDYYLETENKTTDDPFPYYRYMNIFSANRTYDLYELGYNRSWYFRLSKTVGGYTPPGSRPQNDVEIGFSNDTIGSNNTLGDEWFIRLFWHNNGYLYLQFWNDTQFYQDTQLPSNTSYFIDVNLQIYNNTLKAYYKNLTDYNNAFTTSGYTQIKGGYDSWSISNHSSDALHLRYSNHYGFAGFYDVWYYSTLLDPVPPEFINISAFDAFTNKTLKELSINIDGRINTTTNGSVLVNDAEMDGLHTIIVDAKDNDGYFTQTWSNVNLSSDPNGNFSFNLTNARINLSVNYLNTSLSSFQVYLNTTNLTTNNGTVDFNFSKGDLAINITFDGLSYSTYNYHHTIAGNTSYFINVSIMVGFSMCSGAGGNEVLRFSVYEENKTAQFLNSTIEYYMNFGNFSINGNFSGEPDNFTICNNASSTSIFTGDIYVKHYPQVIQGFTHRWYAFNLSLGNSTYNITLYNYNGTSDISDLKVELRNSSDYNYVENVLGKLYRYYVTEGVWKEVQHSLSDNYGQLLYDVKEKDVDYKLSFYNAYNQLLSSTSSMKFLCTAGLCDVTYFIDDLTPSGISNDFLFNYSYSNDTNFIHTNWQDSVTRTVYTRISKPKSVGEINICSFTQTGVAGNVSCNVTGYDGNVWLDVSVLGSNTTIFSGWIQLEMTNLADLLGQRESSFWVFIILIVIAMFGLFSPVGAIITTVFGFFIIQALGLSNNATTPILILICIASAYLGYVLRK